MENPNPDLNLWFFLGAYVMILNKKIDWGFLTSKADGKLRNPFMQNLMCMSRCKVGKLKHTNMFTESQIIKCCMLVVIRTLSPLSFA